MPWLGDPVVAAGTLSGREQPVLRGDGLTLRPWTPEDAAALVEAYQHPDIQHWHMRVFESEEEAAAYIRSGHERWRAESDAEWAVTDTATGTLLGRTALRSIKLAAGFAEISYWVLPTTRREGVASRAVGRVARWALEEVGMHRLELLHSVANEPSCGVARRTGFTLEGTLRKVLLHPDGWHDVHLHARLEDDPVSAR